MKPIKWRLIFVSVLTALSLYFVAPTIYYVAQPKEIRGNQEEFLKRLPDFLPTKHVKFGLDLQGGMQLLLGVNTDSAFKDKLNQIGSDLPKFAEDKALGLEKAYVPRDEKALTVVLKPNQDPGSFNEAFRKEFPRLKKIDRDGQTLRYEYSEAEINKLRASALEQAEIIVRTRVDKFGVSEAAINRRADGTLLVQLPGFTDAKRAEDLLGRTAQLSFKLVNDEFKGFETIKELPEGVTRSGTAFISENKEQLDKLLLPHVPQDMDLLYSRDVIGDGAEVRYRYTSYVLHAATLMTGSEVQDAALTSGDGVGREPQVSLTFTAQGGRRFAQITGDNINKRLGIILDGVLQSAPVIQAKIHRNAAISLGKSSSYSKQIEEGKSLALVLKSGAIPATITILEHRQVGASLGPELANQGFKGIGAGLLLVLAFMMLYYRRPGLIACVALLLNGLFLVVLMAGFGFALSLPGIAALVLTLGMAVDANVLINERIRQEIREGKNARKAVQAGFEKAFWTIVDGNLTTLIAALVLLETNATGPIRGFAVTIMLGLTVSLFTSLYCTRLLFDIALRRVSDKAVKSWLYGTDKIKPLQFNFNFLKFGASTTVISVVLGLVILGTAFVKGLNFGVDFAGGTETVVAFQKDIEAERIRSIADNVQLEGFSVQALDGGKKSFLLRYDENKSDAGSSSAQASESFIEFKNALDEGLKEYEPEIIQVSFVGPQVGKELRNKGILSVLYAILAVLLYIAFRFDMRFGPGAMIKMFLDIFILLGFYVFFGASFDLVAVAAFLTVVGYSVNDTIVIYDRIRENLVDFPRRPLAENINLSLNETLTRSINTSLTTVGSLIGILIFGTGQIWYFAMAMSLGVIIATLSSTFIATSFVLWLENWRAQKRISKTA